MYGVVDYGIQRFLKQFEAPGPDQWRAALEKTLTLLRENRTEVLTQTLASIVLSWVERGDALQRH